MTTQKRALQEALENTGWSIVEVITSNLEWWADEVWLIRQEQKDKTISITFVVDSWHNLPRKKGEDVSYATASSVEPQQRGEVEFSLRRGWAEHLPAFIDYLNSI